MEWDNVENMKWHLAALDEVLTANVMIGVAPNKARWMACAGMHTWRNVQQFKEELDALWREEVRRVAKMGTARVL